MYQITLTLNPSQDPEFTEQLNNFLDQLPEHKKKMISAQSVVAEPFSACHQGQLVPNACLKLGDEVMDVAEGRFGFIEKLYEMLRQTDHSDQVRASLIPATASFKGAYLSSIAEGEQGYYLTGGLNEGFNGDVTWLPRAGGHNTLFSSGWCERYGHTSVYNQNQLWLIGGSSLENRFINSVDIIDPLKGALIAQARLTIGRYKHLQTQLNSETLVVSGGLTSDSARSTLIETIHLNDRHIVKPGSAPANRFGHAVNRVDDYTMILSGGIYEETHQNFRAPPSDEIVLFDLRQQECCLIGKLRVPRAFHSAILSSNKRYLTIAGGFSQHQAINSVEIFDLHSGVTTQSGRLAVNRSNHAALSVKDKGCLLMGGVNGHQMVSIIEMIDSEGGSRIVGSMQTARHSFDVIDQGRSALILSGVNSGKIVAGMELIDYSRLLSE